MSSAQKPKFPTRIQITVYWRMKLAFKIATAQQAIASVKRYAQNVGDSVVGVRAPVEVGIVLVG